LNRKSSRAKKKGIVGAGDVTVNLATRPEPPTV
jgi:hypothetical protein